MFTVFENKEEAKDVIESDDFWTIKNGRVYCGECK